MQELMRTVEQAMLLGQILTGLIAAVVVMLALKPVFALVKFVLVGVSPPAVPGYAPPASDLVAGLALGLRVVAWAGVVAAGIAGAAYVNGFFHYGDSSMEMGVNQQPAQVILHMGGVVPGQAPQRGTTFLAAAGLVVGLALAMVVALYFYFKPPAPPAVVERVVEVEKPVVVEKVVERVVQVEKPAPPEPDPQPDPEPIPPPAPAAPPPPPSPPPAPWTGLWVGCGGKVTIRLSEDDREMTGYYSPHNTTMKPGDVEHPVVTGDTLTFMVKLGDLRHGVRVTKTGDTATVFKWLDDGSVKEAYEKIEREARGKRLTPQQQLRVQQLRQELKGLLKQAGPEHGKDLGIFSREAAPATVPTGRQYP